MDLLNEKSRQAGSPIASGHEHLTKDPKQTYVLMTAAYNEEAHIGRMIESVVSQSVLPARWVIVSDGSFDRTDEIIQKYAEQHDFIRFVRIVRQPGRSFGSKILALHRGCKLLENIEFAFIGNVDADVWLEPSYFEDLLTKFEQQPRLGITGGQFFEDEGGEFKNIKTNRVRSVTHAAQLVRRECYEAIGGYAVLKYGGEDWHAEVTARMEGWDVESVPTFKIFHQRHTGEGVGLLKYKFREGRMDYSFGSDASFEVLKCFLRIPENPFLIGCIARLAGFAWSWIRLDERPVSKNFIAYLRDEQKARLAIFLRGGGIRG